MSDVGCLRNRFPGLTGEWVRLDGPAGTQVVDTAVAAVRDFLVSGDTANVGGTFAASRATTQLVASTRRSVGRLLGGDPAGVVFGANMTSLTFGFTRAVARELHDGDEIVCTRLDHDANVAPWVLAAGSAGARVVMAPFDAATGRLDPEAVIEHVSPRTRWIAITGASNALGSVTVLEPIVTAAHERGARVFVDAVHLVPHRPVDVATLGCDVLATSAYKWYGPHVGALWVVPDLLAALDPVRVRPAPDAGPGRFETGTAAFEALAGVGAAAEFLSESGVDDIARAEAAVFEPLLLGLLDRPHIRVHGPLDLAARTPTVTFTVMGHSPTAVASHLATRRIAVWSGDYYAPEVMATLGLDATGGGVRAGLACYSTPEDVARLLLALDELR